MSSFLRQRYTARVCWWSLDRYLPPAGPTAANPPHATAAVDRWDRQTGGQTDRRIQPRTTVSVGALHPGLQFSIFCQRQTGVVANSMTICVPPTVTYLPCRVSGSSTLTAVGRSQLLARWPGTHSRITHSLTHSLTHYPDSANNVIDKCTVLSVSDFADKELHGHWTIRCNCFCVVKFCFSVTGLFKNLYSPRNGSNTKNITQYKHKYKTKRKQQTSLS